MKKRFLALGLCVVMALSMAACGGKETGSSEVDERPEFVYVPEYFNWDVVKPDNGYVNTYGVTNGYMLGMMNTYDNETGASKQEFLRYRLADGTLTKIPYVAYNMNEYINTVTLHPDGSILACAEEYIWDEQTREGQSHYRLLSIDDTGAVTNSIDMSEIYKEQQEKNDYAYLNTLAVDAEGIVYACFDREVVLVNPDGSKLFGVECSGWIQSMGNMPDGSVFVAHYSNEGTSCLSVIDKAAQSFGTVYDTGINGMSGFYNITDGNILYCSDGSAVRKVDLDAGTNEILFDWLDTDINGQYIQGVNCVDENTVIGYYQDWSTNEESFVKVVKTDSSLVPEKTILTMAALMSDSYIQQSVVAFNKGNTTHRIQLKTYLDLNSMTSSDYENYEQYINDATTRMMNDITGNNPPDIIALTSGYVNLNTLANKGILEDLTPYLEKAGYGKEDFVQGVVNSYSVNGVIYTLPNRFSVSTLLADSAVVGSEEGWTLEEAMEIITNLPEGVSFASYSTQQSFIQQCLMYGYSTFVDEKNGTCNFESEEFKMVLEIAKSFPAEYTYDEDAPSPPLRVQNGDVLTWELNIYELQEIQMGTAIFGDRTPTFIGFPGVAGNGALIQGNGTNYAVCAKSEHKDEAAKFVIDVITKPYDREDWSNWGLPVLMADMEAYIEEELDVEYLKDEKGELILDEEGNPIPTKGGGGVGYGDWEYTYRPSTREEADMLLELVSGACTTAGSYTSPIYTMILEDVAPYLSGDKSVHEVANLIQNRISLYLMENN